MTLETAPTDELTSIKLQLEDILTEKAELEATFFQISLLGMKDYKVRLVTERLEFVRNMEKLIFQETAARREVRCLSFD